MLKSSVGLASLLSLLALSVITFGCSRQGEGERCSLTNGNLDCTGDLICTNFSLLRDRTDEVNRCCPEDETSITVSSCLRRSSSGDDDDMMSMGGDNMGGNSSSGRDPAGLGQLCRWRSDCAQPLDCGPLGVCQFECNEDSDCTDGRVCDGTPGSCVTP